MLQVSFWHTAISDVCILFVNHLNKNLLQDLSKASTEHCKLSEESGAVDTAMLQGDTTYNALLIVNALIRKLFKQNN